MRIYQKKTNEIIYNKLISLGFNNLKSTLISNRINSVDVIKSFEKYSIKDISSPSKLYDIQKASKRIYHAIIKNEIIGIETDHDCDGQTSHAVIYKALLEIFNHPKDRIRSYIGHRTTEGYGLSEALANRILKDSIRPSLIITADNGSTDEARIAKLKENGIDTIITDHHGIPPEGIPKSAYAVLNPLNNDCAYPDKFIAGCMVAWLLMAYVRKTLKENNHQMSSKTSLIDLLDYVAVGTIADCVSMADSINNRIITSLGIRLLNKKKRVCWQNIDSEIDSQYIGFSLAPLLNSNGRLSDALGSVNFLLEEDIGKSNQMYENLKKENELRKSIQKKITQESIFLSCDDNNTVCILLEQGHSGIHGISASRLKEKFGKPVIIFSENINDKNIISGSARSIDDVHIKNILDTIYKQHKDLLIKYGGHKGAAGLTIYKKDFFRFKEIFETTVSDIIIKDNIQLGAKLYYDCMIDDADISEETLATIKELEPYGRGFEKPIFRSHFIIDRFKFVGADNSHCQIFLKTLNNNIFKSIWFNVYDSIEKDFNIVNGNKVDVIFEIQKDTYMGNSQISLNIKHMSKYE